MAGLSTLQSGPKGSEMVKLDVFDHLGPLWARLDPFEPFQIKNHFVAPEGQSWVWRKCF